MVSHDPDGYSLLYAGGEDDRNSFPCCVSFFLSGRLFSLVQC